MQYIKMTTTVGVDVAWHIGPSGDVVIDRSNIPVTEELKGLVCPGWVRDALKEQPNARKK